MTSEVSDDELRRKIDRMQSQMEFRGGVSSNDAATLSLLLELQRRRAEARQEPGAIRQIRDRPELTALIEKAKARFAAMSPDEQEAELHELVERLGGMWADALDTESDGAGDDCRAAADLITQQDARMEELSARVEELENSSEWQRLTNALDTAQTRIAEITRERAADRAVIDVQKQKLDALVSGDKSDVAHAYALRIAELEAALQPFAVVGKIIDGPFGPALFADDDAAFQSGCAWTENGQTKTLTWGDFRRARSVLGGKNGR